ncbi:tRNA (adenosine(37)-N6)-threonylcarbamoyltransferase complex dimerization subunit type 1 TsaB [Cyanobium sp. CH-040]|uniref:tRNA (adenosine(37)-N6)-threonylcarbamoyltransferase complex dimerization subunit type 1 TsaB n=1 Tax=Cyanobium sp. CH-040 TaxID=2823708 RepID=UPI0020CCB424|nr:tRNA (adenosine(37)-N6)-threonylcarbamoyltransferase complex dimerization subunit type 1 TsaB [Cyanobium sp. CH-040]MCP9926785.1 tRNA (adenosine(37)-N6)-threonylcarbamoyltransferase complex dimerization subunit type 1 TsaB [Cyanobium sp. CH-040]
MTGSCRWLLALHSSTAELGVGLRCLEGSRPDRIATFPLGRALSNRLLSCVEEVLPAEDWPALGRLAVATGPGGFTGTRLTVVLARTLAQQLSLPLDGVSSFLLVARRLALSAPTWLVQELPRRGLVAGLYGPADGGDGMVELRQPRLHADAAALAALDPAPQRPAAVAVAEDVAELLALAHQAHRAGREAPWQPVLPAYPTAPVGV